MRRRNKPLRTDRSLASGFERKAGDADEVGGPPLCVREVKQRERRGHEMSRRQKKWQWMSLRQLTPALSRLMVVAAVMMGTRVDLQHGMARSSIERSLPSPT